MTATNHALTGAAIGLIIAGPIAIPIALLSHYVMDALPHYRPNMTDEQLLKSSGFKKYLIAEAIICFLIVFSLFAIHPVNWLLAAVCAFTAAAPDLISYDMYSKTRAGKKWSPNAYIKFASRIQWFERPIGAFVEIAWLCGLLIILSNFV